MADLLDVENALVSLISQTLYPNGLAQPSVTGIPTVVYAGWPTAAGLDADLKALSSNPPGQPITAGKMHVTVFPSKMERNSTRYLRSWVPVTQPNVTLTLGVSGQQVTVGGVVSVPQNVLLMVNGKPYIYGVQAGDTLASVAAKLAALIPGAVLGWTADSIQVTADSVFTADGADGGATITLPATANITAARVGGVGSSVQEIRRQERVFQVIVWGDTPAHRSAVAQAIDPVIGNVGFLSFPDQSRGYLQYKSTMDIDVLSKEILYRRDLFYSVEYATTQTLQTPQIETIGIPTAVGVAPPFQAAFTVSI